MTSNRRLPLLASALAALVLGVGALSACGSSGSDAGTTTISTISTADSTAASGAAPTKTTVQTTEAAAPLRILVTNDDGVGAPGIDAVVNGLETLAGVTVTVVAPATQQSGTGGKTTDGPLTTVDAKTASGHAAKAVDGFPADTIRAAFDDLGLKADVVVSGINAGQNLAPIADVSGTVGAARAAVARGIPALAVSQGIGSKYDFPSAVPFVLDWITKHREALTTGAAAKDVSNMNVPSCSAGKVRGILEVPAAPNGTQGVFEAQDCASTATNPPNDITAFNDGYVALTEPLPPSASGG